MVFSVSVARIAKYRWNAVMESGGGNRKRNIDTSQFREKIDFHRNQGNTI